MRPTLDRKSLGSYTTATLQADERPLHKTTIHWIVLTGPILVSLFSLVIIGPIGMIAFWKGQSWVWLLLAIPVAIIASAALSMKTSELVITDRRVLIKVGFSTGLAIRCGPFNSGPTRQEWLRRRFSWFSRFLCYGSSRNAGSDEEKA